MLEIAMATAPHLLLSSIPSAAGSRHLLTPVSKVNNNNNPHQHNRYQQHGVIFAPPSLEHMTPKRPRLSLQTSGITPTYVGAAGSANPASLDTAITPTTSHNTFTNTFDLTYRPSPSSTLASAHPSGLRIPTQSPPLVSTAISTPASSSATSTSSSTPNEQCPAYTVNLPYGVHPILKNSPLSHHRSSLTTASASPRGAGRRVFFPPPKQVTFKAVLEEEIRTLTYTARHTDLSSSEDEFDSSSSSGEGDAKRDDKTKRPGRRQASASRSTPEQSPRTPTIRVDEASTPASASASPSPRLSRKRSVDDLSSAGGFGSREDRGRRDRAGSSSSSRRSKRKPRRWEWTIGAKSQQQQISPPLRPMPSLGIEGGGTDGQGGDHDDENKNDDDRRLPVELTKDQTVDDDDDGEVRDIAHIGSDHEGG